MEAMCQKNWSNRWEIGEKSPFQCNLSRIVFNLFTASATAGPVCSSGVRLSQLHALCASRQERCSKSSAAVQQPWDEGSGRTVTGHWRLQQTSSLKGSIQGKPPHPATQTAAFSSLGKKLNLGLPGLIAEWGWQLKVGSGKKLKFSDTTECYCVEKQGRRVLFWLFHVRVRQERQRGMKRTEWSLQKSWNKGCLINCRLNCEVHVDCTITATTTEQWHHQHLEWFPINFQDFPSAAKREISRKNEAVRQNNYWNGKKNELGRIDLDDIWFWFSSVISHWGQISSNSKLSSFSNLSNYTSPHFTNQTMNPFTKK